MDDYENVLSGAGSAPTAGGAASPGPGGAAPKPLYDCSVPPGAAVYP